MTAPGQQELELMKRTLDNFHFIDADKEAQRREEIFEITQLVNSFLGVLTHPWEKLFDANKLAELKTDSEEYSTFGFPKLASSWSDDSEFPEDLAHLLRLLRNGIAHGNIDLLSKWQLKQRFGREPSTWVRDNEIAGAEIWNNKEEKPSKGDQRRLGDTRIREAYRSWGTVLTIDDMRQCLSALQLLALRPEFRRTREMKRDGGRRTRSEAKAELRNRVNEHLSRVGQEAVAEGVPRKD